MGEAGRKGQVASSGPSLSLPVFDSARSAKEGSFPSFSGKLCIRFFLLIKLLSSSQRWKGANRSSPMGLQKLSDSLPERQKVPILSCQDSLRPTPLYARQKSVSVTLLLKYKQLTSGYFYFLFSYKYQMQWTTT